jgi:hypothetical protein
LRDFVERPDVLLTIDAIARRYGILPHQVLDLSPWDLGLALQCLQQAAASAAQTVQRMQQASNGSMIPTPIPVVIIPSPYGGM